jgi:hypothetical protein
MWLSREWQEKFFASISRELTLKRVSIQGNGFQSIRIMPWSFVGLLSTDCGDMYAKSVSSVASFEPELTAALSDLSTSVVDVIAYSGGSGWLVTQGCDEMEERTDFELLKLAVERYAKLQIKSLDSKEQIIATGLPVIEPGKSAIRYERTIERLSALPVDHPSRINEDEAYAMKALTDRVTQSERMLLDSNIPSTIEHGDLLPKNLLQTSDKQRTLKWFDFGDASWNFPFTSIDMLTDSHFSFLSEEQISEMIKLYLDVWKDHYPREQDLRVLFDEAMTQAAIRRAEVRLDVMEQVPADALGDLASFVKDEFLLIKDKLVA